jgi:hypothetical protein
MKLRHPYLHFGLLFTIFIILITVGVPDSAAANARAGTGYQLFPGMEIKPGLISAREQGIDFTSSAETWTLARMEAAQPYPLPDVDQLPQTPAAFNVIDQEPIYLPSVPPAAGTESEPSGDDPALPSELSITGYEYPAPFTRYENFDSYQVFPYSTIGVLFFTQRGTDYRCSATVVGENAVWTAGHCVHDGSGEQEGWSDDVFFVPAYKDGVEPYGRWSYFDLATRVAWFNGGDLRFDIGGVILNPNGSSQSVQDVVGSLGFAYNLSSNQHWFNIAYPSEPPFDGNMMQICAGSFARYATSSQTPIPVGMGCDMTKGSSGGAWIINFSGSSGSTNYVNGNNSFRYTGFDKEIYSPYFGDAAKDLLDFISSDTSLLTNITIPFITNTGDQ